MAEVRFLSSSTPGRDSRRSTQAWPGASIFPSAGSATLFAGVGCTGTAQPVAIDTWSLDGVSLAPQQLTAATLPQIGGKGEPAGLLGSDVLGRFGAVRIDFAAAALLVPGDEGAPLTGSGPYTGPSGPPPAVLTQGEGYQRAPDRDADRGGRLARCGGPLQR